jgi:hypothetical protein
MRVSELIKKNPTYTLTYTTMLSYMYAYLGSYVFKHYTRRKRPSEDSALYVDLVANTVSQPICRYIVDSINNVLFEPGTQRDIRFCTPEGTPIDPEMAEWSDLFMLDADLQNRTLDSFMEGIGDLTSIFGHCWVFVDMPQAIEGNLGRPYVCAVSPLDVWDWEFEYIGGKAMVKYVKVKESEDEDSFHIKCYHLGDATTPTYWRSYEVPKNPETNVNTMESEAVLEGEGFYPPGMAVPGFIAYGRRDPRTIEVGVSDIDSATDAQREHYKLECEAYSSIQFAKTIIRADKGISIPVHAGAIVRGVQGCIEAIAVDTNDVDKIIAKQTDILENLEALTGLGGLRNNKSQVQSGVSIIEERRTLHRVAKAKARLMEVVESNIMTFAARFMEMRWAGQINYNTDYEAHDTNYRIALMKAAKELVPNNPMIDNLIAREVINMLAPANEKAEYAAAFTTTITDPATKILMEEEDAEVTSNDIGSMIPVEPETEKEGMDVNPDGTTPANSAAVGGAGTPIQNMGQSYYTQDAIAAQLNNLNVGR